MTEDEYTMLDEMIEAGCFEECPDPEPPEEESLESDHEEWEKATDPLDPRNWEPWVP